jgi:hypothetical protein
LPVNCKLYIYSPQ